MKSTQLAALVYFLNLSSETSVEELEICCRYNIAQCLLYKRYSRNFCWINDLLSNQQVSKQKASPSDPENRSLMIFVHPDLLLLAGLRLPFLQLLEVLAAGMSQLSPSLSLVLQLKRDILILFQGQLTCNDTGYKSQIPDLVSRYL